MKEVTIKINIELAGKKKPEITFTMNEEVYNKIINICEERKADITDLLINDITEMTPEQAEEIVMGWDM